MFLSIKKILNKAFTFNTGANNVYLHNYNGAVFVATPAGEKKSIIEKTDEKTLTTLYMRYLQHTMHDGKCAGKR